MPGVGFLRDSVREPRGAENIGSDEIGAVELGRAAGRKPALDIALKSAARPHGPMLVVAARDDIAPALRHYMEAFGIGASLAEASDPEACLRAVRGLLQR